MEPGGIEPAPIPCSEPVNADNEDMRAILRAVQGDPSLTHVVLAWGALPESVRTAITLLVESASERRCS